VVAVPVPEARSIDIRDNRFEPADATVVPGTTLMWINYDQVQHTVTADDGQFDSGALDPGDIFMVTVEGSGKLTYHCSLHPEMKGGVTVGEGGEAGEATTEEEAKSRPRPAYRRGASRRGGEYRRGFSRRRDEHPGRVGGVSHP
jgi:hypothetical protein